MKFLKSKKKIHKREQQKLSKNYFIKFSQGTLSKHNMMIKFKLGGNFFLLSFSSSFMIKNVFNEAAQVNKTQYIQQERETEKFKENQMKKLTFLNRVRERIFLATFAPVITENVGNLITCE